LKIATERLKKYLW